MSSMSENKKIDHNYLYVTALREMNTESIQEINSNFYIDVSSLLDKIKTEEYDGIEVKVKTMFINITLDMISLIIEARLDKAIKLNTDENLLDVEQWILDKYRKFDSNTNIIIDAIKNGNNKLIQSISNRFKTKLVTVRFLHDLDEIVGFDLNKYGPFKREDVATIPNKNAQVLIKKKIIEKIYPS